MPSLRNLILHSAKADLAVGMKKLLTLCLIGLTSTAFAADSILIVLTNHSELGDTGKKTGFYLSEASHPYEVFTKAGYEVSLASPEGGEAPVDPSSMDLKDEANKTFWVKYGNGDEQSPFASETKKLSEINARDYEGIFFAGGHGTVWDFPNSEALQDLTSSIYASGGVVGAVCHGPAALLNVKLPNGTHLIDGKKVAVFTNEEEEAVELTKVVPMLLETSFEDKGAMVQLADKFTENAVRDGRLVTGQNPASAKKTAELFVAALKDRN